MIRVAHPGSRLRILIFLPIPDPVDCWGLSLVGPTGTSQRLLLTPGGHPPHPSSNLDSLRGCLQFFSVFFVRHTIFYVCRHFVPCIHHSLWAELLPYVQPRGLLPDIQGVCCHSCHSHLSFTCWCKPGWFVHIVTSLQNFESLSHVQLMSPLLQWAKSEFSQLVLVLLRSQTWDHWDSSPLDFLQALLVPLPPSRGQKDTGSGSATLVLLQANPV